MNAAFACFWHIYEQTDFLPQNELVCGFWVKSFLLSIFFYPKWVHFPFSNALFMLQSHTTQNKQKFSNFHSTFIIRALLVLGLVVGCSSASCIGWVSFCPSSRMERCKSKQPFKQQIEFVNLKLYPCTWWLTTEANQQLNLQCWQLGLSSTWSTSWARKRCSTNLQRIVNRRWWRSKTNSVFQIGRPGALGARRFSAFLPLVCEYTGHSISSYLKRKKKV